MADDIASQLASAPANPDTLTPVLPDASHPADGLTDAPVPDISTRLSAAAALGLDESPRDTANKIGKEVHPKTPPLQRGEDGKFLPRESAPKAPAKPKSSAPTVTAPTPPTPPAAPAAPPTPPAPAKLKVGAKEYSAEELEALIAKANQPAPAPPQAPLQPPPPAPKPPTAEEIAAAETKYLADLNKAVGVPEISEQLMDTIFTGGKEGAAALSAVVRDAAARAILETRKSIYKELDPILTAHQAALRPLVDQSQQLDRITIEQEFVHSHPEFTGESLNLARQVAETLATQYPDQVNAMSRQQFVTEVARQTDRLLNGQARQLVPGFTGTWKDLAKFQAATAVPTAPTAPVAPVVPVPKVKPPAGNSPGSVTGMTQGARGFQRTTAASLSD